MVVSPRKCLTVRGNSPSTVVVPMPEGRAEGATFLPVAEADAEEEEPEVLEEPQAARARAPKEPSASAPKERRVILFVIFAILLG